jgi:hypothetical protein
MARWRLIAACLCVFSLSSVASALAGTPIEDDSGAEWAVAQPLPPSPPAGVEEPRVPISLGSIGDIKFEAPNRGALITSGNGSSIPAGVWLYNGVRWRELSDKCGATDGRVAWAGPDEFWTVSDGRRGQAQTSKESPPIEDDTLCHFAPGPTGALEIVGSYASLPFLASSYLPMHAAGCIAPNDCWFGGDPLHEPQTGSFQLHWDGSKIEREPYLPEGHGVRDMQPFAGQLYEGLRLLTSDRPGEVQRPAPALVINPQSSATTFEALGELPLYEAGEFSFALDFLHLGADSESIWAAAGAVIHTPAGSEEAGVTVLHKTASSEWAQVLGPQSSPSGRDRFPQAVVDAIAAEPETSSAWLALDSKTDADNLSPLAHANLVRITTDGTISDELSLPAPGGAYGPLGAARQLVCPAVHDCWLSTLDGWLLHLATSPEQEAEKTATNRDADPVFASEEPITFRPPDEGVPQEPSDELPLDTSESEAEPPVEVKEPPAKVIVTDPLLTHLRSRLLHHTTLQLSFHLAVKARVNLRALRHSKLVASTGVHVLGRGNRTLTLLLNPRRWPTKLDLQTHALAKLPTHVRTGAPSETSTKSAPSRSNTVGTRLVEPARLISEAGSLGWGAL